MFCALSCFILALPHFIYGPGEDALSLTKEYMDSSRNITIDNSAVEKLFSISNRLCLAEPQKQECNDELESIVPLVLIFLSQFVLGIGNTLYYALGQTYLDDNTKKTNTPLLLSYAFSLRTFGPGENSADFICLNCLLKCLFVIQPLVSFWATHLLRFTLILQKRL